MCRAVQCLSLHFLLTFFLIPQSLSAQTDKSDHRIARYLDSQTVLVGWLDISKVDLNDLLLFMNQLEPRQSDPERFQKITAVRDALIQLKVQRVYWISDLAGLMKGPESIVIPTVNPVPVAALLKALGHSNESLLFEVDGDCLIGNTQQGITALRTKNGEPTAELLNAVAACEGFHGIVLATPEYVTATAAGLMTALAGSQSAEYGKLASSIGVHLPHVRWAGIHGELPPSTVTLRLETKSADGAQKLADTLNEITTALLPDDAKFLRVTATDNSVLLKSSSTDDSLKKLDVLKQLVHGTRPMESGNSMKHLALAMHNYHDTHGHFPPQSLVNQQGQRLLSWRVLVLPFLDQLPLYQEFHLDEAWDSPHNKTLIAKMPPVLQSPGDLPAGEGLTRFVVPLTERSVMGRRGPPVTFRDIIDGTSNTLWLVEADPSHAVIWTKPEDLPIQEKDPVGSIIDAGTPGFWSSMADGSARYLSREIDSNVLNQLLTIDGGEVIDRDALK